MSKQTPDILSAQAQKHINLTILKLAWPAILEQFLICMASLADTAMVGSIGASATAAVAVNISSIWLINGFITSEDCQRLAFCDFVAFFYGNFEDLSVEV